MANHGGGGNKFVSVNLNKSYGQQQPRQQQPSLFGSNRARPTGGSNGGGMVLLSRPRSSQKVVGSKLSVPPPLNLPSLRKEHEHFDSSGLGGGGANGGAGTGSGSRPNSSGMGWSKPGIIANQEKVGSDETQVDSIDQGLHSTVNGIAKGNSIYMPPLARPGVVGSVQAYHLVDKAMVLRGEDFPSLRATLSTDSGPAHKQKDGLNLKQKHMISDEASNDQKNSSQYSSITHIQLPVQSDHHSFDSRFGENVSRRYGLGTSDTPELARKQGEYFSGPLSHVWMKPRSDWADDERDTRHGVADRSRDNSAQKNEGHWDREYNMTRDRIPSPKAAPNRFDKWGKQDGETGKMPSSELFRVDSYGKDAGAPSSREGREGNAVNFQDPYGRNVRPPSREGREGNSWRSSSFATKNGTNAHEVEINKNGVKAALGNQVSPLGKRDLGYGEEGRYHFNNTVEPFSSRGMDWSIRERYGGNNFHVAKTYPQRYGGEQYDRYSGDTLQNRFVSKSSSTLDGRGLHNNDSVVNSVRDKRSFVKSEKTYVEDPFLKDFGGTGFDGRDPFTGAPVGVVKRKKDVITDFHDPVRVSFEAELERVQKMQEQERQRIIEEQERSMELAQREEEERTRLARERRRVEEEAREAAWREEQERVDAIRRIEEQKIAREEEKHKMLMEEERRKHAAKMKLLELEERMFRRHAEVADDNNLPGIGEEKELSSTRCDSQSSLSVSSPPSSPTQLSHDEFNDFGEFPDLSTAEGNIISLSGNEPASTSISGNGNIIAGSSSLSDDDEEWAVESNERLQEQEEYDEVEDGYQEDDEVHEGDDENNALTHEFDDMHLEVKCSGHTRDNLVLGFNEGVEVEMPIDEFDKSSMIEENAFAMPQTSYRTVSEQDPFDGLHSDEQNSPQVGISSSTTRIQETEKIKHDFVVQTTDEPNANSTPSTLHSVSVSTGLAIHSQADLPVKLQFGLFSGPSLIPSPVPAIQIGSIQMPLHMHPQYVSSLSHMHTSHPPLFQFNQVRYTSPMSQGIQPMGPPSMSFVQPSFHAQFPVNQNRLGPPSIQAGQETQSTTQNLVRNAESNTRSEEGFQTDDRQKPGTVSMNCVSRISREMEAQTQTSDAIAPSVSTEREITGSKAPGPISRGRGKKFVFSAKNPGPRSQFVSPEASRLEASGFQSRQRQNFQGTEFYVRGNADRRQSSGSIHPGMDKSNFNRKGTEVYVRKGPKRSDVLIRPSNQTLGPESFNSGPLDEFGSKSVEKEASTKSHNISRSEEGNLKRNIEEDIDASLQSCFVRVYEQPGIDVPSDDDDFIEVRSKRQILNDRREQREREIKAKSRLTKALRKPRSTSQSTMVPSSHDRISPSMHGKSSNNIRSDFVISKGLSLVNSKVSASLNTTSVSQPLAPIGTPAVNNEIQADIRSQAIKSLPVISGGETKLGSGVIFETNSNILDNAQTSLGCWSNARIDQQVMDLTQNQLDDAMKPARFDTLVSSLGDCTGKVSVPSSSASSKDKQFASAASSVNSLLAGEKIQFGAVTSPTVLPTSKRSVSHGIATQGSCRSNIQIPQNISGSEKGCNLFYKKEKHGNESCANVEDSVAEADASPLALAAFKSDEHVTCSVSVSDTKSVGGADNTTITAGVNSAQASAEESLSVALPADLSVETTPISMWQPSQSPQNSSSQMFPPFHAGPAPNFPYYDINPMMGRPIYTYGPQDESGGTQSQAQKGSAPVSGGTLGAWSQSHSSVDSFYGPPAGLTGPFISPSGGIPGPHQHMVVYNHFAPVGQFRQVGLSFMGTTYIPSGKQPDWKHNPSSSAMGISEGDMSNMNVVSAQRSSPIMPAPPMQHLAPGSPLLPMAPVAMFPFQSSPDMSAPNCWPHVSASPLQSVLMSLPMQQQPEGVLPQFSHGSPMDQSLTSKRFPESRSLAPSDINRSFVVASEVTDQLGLGDSSNSSNCGVSTQTFVAKISSGTGSIPNENRISSNTGYNTQPSQHNNLSHQQQNYSSDYNYRRGGISQKKNSGVEWSHRRAGGFQPRNHNLGAEKNFHSSKMKQIYVAKQQPTSETPAAL